MKGLKRGMWFLRGEAGAHTHLHAHVCTCTRVYTCLHTCVHTCKQPCLRAHTHVHAQTHNTRVHPRRSTESPGLGNSGACWRVGGGGARWALPGLTPCSLQATAQVRARSQHRAGQAVECKWMLRSRPPDRRWCEGRSLQNFLDAHPPALPPTWEGSHHASCPGGVGRRKEDTPRVGRARCPAH